MSKARDKAFNIRKSDLGYRTWWYFARRNMWGWPIFASSCFGKGFLAKSASQRPQERARAADQSM